MSSEQAAEWQSANAAKLPELLKSCLQYVAQQTADFEQVGWLDPAQLASGGSRNEFPNTQPTMTELFTGMMHGKPEAAILKMVSRMETVTPQRPFTAEALREMLNRDGGLNEDDVAWLCENLRGYSPSTNKAPLEDWLFDSLLASSQQVIPKLWLGGRKAAHDVAQIDAMGVSHVLCVGGKSLAYGAVYEPPFPDKLTYKVIDVEDVADPEQVALLKATIESAIEFIDIGRDAGGVYVHCMAGASRSASTVCAYLMKRHGLSFEEALAVTRLARPCVNPNPGFTQMLQSL